MIRTNQRRRSYWWLMVCALTAVLAAAASVRGAVGQTADTDGDGGDSGALVVRAASLQVSESASPADCQSSRDDTTRYFTTVTSTNGSPITNATGRLIGTGTENRNQVINMSNGDFESLMDDGFPASGCRPAVNDGIPNDIASPWVPTAPGTHTWTLRILAAGYQPPPPIDLSTHMDGISCPREDDAGCLIKIGIGAMLGGPATGGVSGDASAPTTGPVGLVATPRVMPTLVPFPTLPPTPTLSEPPPTPRPIEPPPPAQPTEQPPGFAPSPPPVAPTATPEPPPTESPPVDPVEPEEDEYWEDEYWEDGYWEDDGG
jgi:hypothetical protein